MDYSAVKVHYFDASALVKLVADDQDEAPGRDVLRKYYEEHARGAAYTTSFCVAEAFGAFKRKFQRKSISEEQYLTCVRNFIRVIGNTFRIDEVPILLPLVTSEVERLVSKYKIDFVDCFQIVT